MQIYRVMALGLALALTTGCGGDDGGSPDAAPIDAMVDAQPADAEPDAAPVDAEPDALPVDAAPDVMLAPVEVGNVDRIGVCPDARRVLPALPGEANHWALERLVPPTTPMRVEGVRYQLLGADPEEGEDCRTALPHRVMVFVAPDGPPPASPSTANPRLLDVTLEEGALTSHDQPLDPPLVVGAGEALFVGVQMVADVDTGESLCLGACPASLAERSYWSNRVIEPFPWGDLVVEFGLAENYTIRAYGQAPP